MSTQEHLKASFLALPLLMPLADGAFVASMFESVLFIDSVSGGGCRVAAEVKIVDRIMHSFWPLLGGLECCSTHTRLTFVAL